LIAGLMSCQSFSTGLGALWQVRAFDLWPLAFDLSYYAVWQSLAVVMLVIATD